ncbi:response regulator [Fischerella sp. NIES-3754]|uniref:response regulator n=1 Tax=Fischerella sp. NIES-3754 TaxID=1752063 RepID=UPI000722869A|nr:response regulator [Fischerella sp. NIES-3754]BAU06726.1 response regulator receiver protein PatA [Fischerella sp. NIES-3754]
MKILPINRYRFYQSLQPLFLLKKITSKSTAGCLQVFTASGSWSIYVEEGKLIYACCTEKMFELLYKHLQRLSQKIPTLHNGIKEQLRAIFETGIENQAIPNPDYLAICWLVNQKYITPVQAGILVEQLALEVLESFLLLKEGSYEFAPESFLDEMPKFCHLDVRLLVERCQRRSPGYASIPSGKSERSSADAAPPQPASLERRHLNHQSGSEFAANCPQQTPQRTSKGESTPNSGQQQHLHVVPPSQQPLPKPRLNNVLPHPVNTNNSNRPQISRPNVDKKLYTVFCIDDSPAVVNAISKFLDDQIFSVVGINDPLKALMQIIRLKPDLILLDIEMPNLDGYELCSLVRKHSHFKDTPIIMITGRTGFIDKARAKLVRASGYLSKPFTQADLLKEVFQHIK